MRPPFSIGEAARCLARSSLLRFVLGGVVTYAVTLGLMAFWLRVAGAPRPAAYALTHATALAVGFALNRRWVFRATAGRPVEQGIRFVLAQAGFRALDWLLYTLLELMLSPPVALGVLAANLLVLPAKYLFYRHHVFAVRRAPAVVSEEGLCSSD